MAWRDPVSNLTFVAPGASKRVPVSAAPALKRHRLLLSDSIATLRGVKSGLRHMAGGKGLLSSFLFVFAGDSRGTWPVQY